MKKHPLFLTGNVAPATVSGIEMFVAQAAKQFETWTGRTAPLDVMRKTVERELSAAR